MTDRIYKPKPGDVVDPYGALARVDAARPRSGSGPGPSSFFSCPRQVGSDYRGDPPQREVWEDDKLRAIIGTLLHAGLEVAHEGNGRQEIVVRYRDVVGHTDWLPPEDGPDGDAVIDWKSTTLEKLEKIKLYGISLTYRAQGGFYGVGTGRKRVKLVFIPVDGGKDDILIVEFDVDVALVDAAVDWLHSIRVGAEQGIVPLPDPPWARNVTAVRICRRYCRHYRAGADPTGTARDGCPGPPQPEPLPALAGGLFQAV